MYKVRKLYVCRRIYYIRKQKYMSNDGNNISLETLPNRILYFWTRNIITMLLRHEQHLKHRKWQDNKARAQSPLILEQTSWCTKNELRKNQKLWHMSWGRTATSTVKLQRNAKFQGHQRYNIRVDTETQRHADKEDNKLPQKKTKKLSERDRCHLIRSVHSLTGRSIQIFHQ